MIFTEDPIHRGIATSRRAEKGSRIDFAMEPKTVLFTANKSSYSGFDDASIEVMSLGDRRKKTLMRGGTYGRYVPSGHLLYVNRGTLFAVPFDLGALEVRGAPTPVQDQVAYSSNNGDAGFEASQTGTVLYKSGIALGGAVSVQWLESDGKTRALLPKTRLLRSAEPLAGRTAAGDGGHRRVEPGHLGL
jgi:hypothetical protein